MRFLQQVVVPLLVVGAAARSNLRIRDGDTLGGLNVTDSIGATENVDSTDNVDNIDNVDSTDAMEGVDAGGVSSTFLNILGAKLTSS
jgi:hypothetical protein